MIGSVKALKTNQTEQIARLRNQLSDVDNLMKLAKSNEFTAGLVFGSELFGTLNVVEPRSVSPSSSCDLQSKIVTAQQCADLMRVCEFSLNAKWTLLYRASEHGFEVKDFHSKCDNKSNTLTLIKPHGSPNIFGGFTSASWDSISGYKTDCSAFIFSLVNKDQKPLKMRVSKPESAIYCCSSYGPLFGGYDIYIANRSDSNTDSYPNLGHSYSHPQYAYLSVQAQHFLAGASNFQVGDIEVYARN